MRGVQSLLFGALVCVGPTKARCGMSGFKCTEKGQERTRALTAGQKHECAKLCFWTKSFLMYFISDISHHQQGAIGGHEPYSGGC